MATLVIRLYSNKMEIKNDKTNTIDTIIPDHEFSNNRLLIASITNATECLSKYIYKNTKSLIKPKIIIIPKEIIVKDISEADIKTIEFVAYQSGAREVIIQNNE